MYIASKPLSALNGFSFLIFFSIEYPTILDYIYLGKGVDSTSIKRNFIFVDVYFICFWRKASFFFYINFAYIIIVAFHASICYLVKSSNTKAPHKWTRDGTSSLDVTCSRDLWMPEVCVFQESDGGVVNHVQCIQN